MTHYAEIPGFGPDTAELAESLPRLLRRLRDHTPTTWLVENLIPGDGTILIHSQPREYKTLIALTIALALTLARSAFDLLRTVREPVPVWYITEEDSGIAWEHGWRRCWPASASIPRLTYWICQSARASTWMTQTGRRW